MPSSVFIAPVFILPSLPRVTSGGAVALSAVGGSGSDYSFSLSTNKSGATVSGTTYTGGPMFPATDVITCTDGAGNTGTREVNVVEPSSSLANIRTECKQRTDLVNSQFITDDEWARMINASGALLYDIIVAAYGNDYNVAPPYQWQTDGVTQRYPLPPDFFKLLGMDVQISNTTSGWLTLPKFNFAERNKFMTPYQLFYGVRTNLHYRLVGEKVWLIPIAAAGQWVQMHYVPKYTRLAQDTDVLNGFDGWEELVKNDVCAKACVKRETDGSEFLAERTTQLQRLQVIAEERDLGGAATVADVRAQEDDDMFRGGSGGVL